MSKRNGYTQKCLNWPTENRRLSHNAELKSVSDQLAASDARIKASQEETQLQRMQFERDRDKIGNDQYQRAVQMLEAKEREHAAILAENTRALTQTAQIMQREMENKAAWAAKEHNERQQELSNAMARQKEELDKQLA